MHNTVCESGDDIQEKYETWFLLWGFRMSHSQDVPLS